MSSKEGYTDLLDDLRSKAVMPDESMILSDTGNGAKRVRSTKHGAAIVLPTAAERKAMDAQKEAEVTYIQPVVEEPKKRGRKPKQAAAQPVLPGDSVTIIIDDLEISTFYTHVYTGAGILILGMIDNLSQRPKNAAIAPNGNYENIVNIKGRDGSFIYCGNSFRDKDGVENLVLIQLPKRS